MRLFIAVTLPAVVQNSIIGYMDQMGKNGVTGRFVRRDSMHITLHFFGEISREEMKPICRAMEETARKCNPFTLCLGRSGFFGGEGRRVLWLGLQNEKELLTLQTQLEEELEQAGFLREARPFRPHITLARQVQWEEIPALAPGSEAFSVDEMVLFESRREQNGRYRYVRQYSTPMGRQETNG